MSNVRHTMMLAIDAAPQLPELQDAPTASTVRVATGSQRARALSQFKSVAGADDSDECLAGLASLGDAHAFDLLVQRYRTLMYVCARRRLGSDAEADDVVQESLAHAWTKLSTLKDLAAVRSWMLRIVASRSVDVLRRRREHASVEEAEFAAPDDGSPTTNAQLALLSAALHVALSNLPEPQRRCWVLRELESLSYQEIADELELPVSTVRGAIARARKALAVAMAEWR
ncbi:RNA polymerase sigma factor [Pseudoclavibacter terrae]|uniref:RNA polymerase sigma factor n=1 Tax=Pseudoclavibacter terrae TaxID=1530195 RepID=UPI00232D9183|nr:RNA polymerase sigma factor [Pseudoclavibacter terrae]